MRKLPKDVRMWIAKVRKRLDNIHRSPITQKDGHALLEESVDIAMDYGCYLSDGDLWDVKDEPEIVSFQDLALGSKFKYPGGTVTWIILQKNQKKTGGLLHGILAQYDEKYMKSKWVGQRMASHIPEEEGGDCPDLVEFVG